MMEVGGGDGLRGSYAQQVARIAPSKVKSATFDGK